MVAANPVLKTEIGSRSGNGRQGDWQLVGNYLTIEQAVEAAEVMTKTGLEARICMIDGLSVLVRS